jgi:autotransporter-associated beta strand protein
MSNRQHSTIGIAIALAATLALVSPAVAQNAWTWTGATSGAWTTASNWNPATAPTSGTDTVLTFGAATNTTMSAPQYTVNQLDFQAGGPAYTLNPAGINNLTFATSSGSVGPQIIMDTDSTVTVNDPLQLSNNLAVTGAGAGTLAVPNIFGAGSLTMSATGTLKLRGAVSTFSGGTFVTAGTLLLGSGTGLPTSSNLTISGGTFSTGGLSNGSGTSLGTVNLSGTGKFLIPSGTSDYYLNQLQMTGGTLDASGADSFTMHITYGAGITINQGVTTWSGANGRIVNDTGSPTPINVGNYAYNGFNLGFALSSAGANPNFTLTSAGGGEVRLSNAGNTANITLTNSTFLYTNDLSTNVGSGAFGTLGTGTFTLNSSFLVYDGPTATSAKPLTLAGGGGAISPQSNLTLTGVISGSAASDGLAVDGPLFYSATLTLTANNTFTGAIFVNNNAVLAVPTIANAGAGGTASPLGASSNAVGNLLLGRTGLGRGDLLLTGTSASYSTDRGATVGGLYTAGEGGGIGVQNVGTTLNWGGPITSLANTGSFIKSGAGTLVLYSNANNYAGGTYIEGGTLQLGLGGGGFPTNGTIPSTGLLNLLGGTFDMNGLNQTVTSLAGAAGTSVLTGGGTLTAGSDNSSTTFAGNLIGGSFVKTGTGTITLTGVGNTANLTTIGTGAISVSDMATSGVGALGTGTLTLQGSGDSGGGLVYTGPSATSTKNITLAGSSTIQVSTPGSNLMLNGIISQSGGLIVTGPFNDFVGMPSTLTLNANNTYKGKTEIFGNAVVAIPMIGNAGVPSPLGASTSAPANLQLGSGTSTGALLLTGTNASYSTDRGVTLVNGASIGVQSAATTLTWSGQITGGGSLHKTGAGILVLSNTNQYNPNANNFTGGVFVDAGKVMLGTGAVLAMPPRSDVTIAARAEYNTGGLDDGGGDTLGTVTLNGGTFRLPAAGGTNYFINKLIMNGGTMDGTPPGSTAGNLWLNQSGVAITVNANSSWTGPSTFYVGNASEGELPITIAPGVTLTSSVSLARLTGFGIQPFRVTGGGTLYLTSPPSDTGPSYNPYVRVNQARLRMDYLTHVAPGDFDLTLDNGTLQYSGTTTAAAGFSLSDSGGTLEISNAATTVTITGPIYGTVISPFTKAGPGTLVLTSSGNTFGGGLTIANGTIQTASDNTLGQGPITVAAFGTLQYTADTASARMITLNSGVLAVATGATLTLDGAQIGGGFLRGPGTVALTGASSIVGATSVSGSTINQTGAAAVANFTSGGAFVVGAGQTLNWNGGLNGITGALTVNGTAAVSNFGSSGLVTVNTGGSLTDSNTPLVLGGGSRTYIGSAATPGGTVNLSGQTLELNGGLLVNNGAISGTVNVNYGGLAKGAGVYDIVNVADGGVLAPGNSPGILTAATVRFNTTSTIAGPVLSIELAGTTPGIQYDQLRVTSALSLGGTLAVTLINGFTPAAGNSFDILDWGTLSGKFSSIQLPSLAAPMGWDTSQLYTTGAITATAYLKGDINRDGRVDVADVSALESALADLNKYQSTNGLSAPQLTMVGDLTGDGKVDNADFQRLIIALANGAAGSGGGGSVAAVPEPATWVLAAIAFVCCLIGARARKVPD